MSTKIEKNNVLVGKINPIELPIVKQNDFLKNLGNKIGQGGFSTIYEVKNKKPLRIYKIISEKNFKNGNEIKISEIAGNLRVAPTFHRAFVVEKFYHNQDPVVVIEMDHAGKTLAKLMEDFYREKNVGIINNGKKRVSQEDAIDKMYEKRETFYYELFEKIKKLAKNNIAYCDIHVGNIIPNYNIEKDFQLIDFDKAKLMEDVENAVQKALEHPYVSLYFQDFQKLKNLSKQSNDLIKWFNDKNNPQLAKLLKKLGMESLFVK
jgi:hypothetical protein